MSSFEFSPSALSFNSTFAGIPVLVGYEIEANEDHRGRAVGIIPTICVIGRNRVALCENVGFFRLAQLKQWLAQQAKADYTGLLADDSEPNDYVAPWAASATEDRWIAQRDHVHYCRAGR